MESCNICCFPYTDQQDSDGISKVKKVLCCQHSLCKSCYLRLDKTICPFCRSIFNYTQKELKERRQLNLDYNNWQPPSQISDYIPPTNSQIRRPNRTVNNVPNLNPQFISANDSQMNESLIIAPEAFSRVRKNMVRNRRRNLEFDEVLERRRMIKKRCQKKWSRKNLRVEKELKCIQESNNTPIIIS